MEYTEQDISQALDGHFFVMLHDPGCKVVDTLGNPRHLAKPPSRPWTDDDLRQLWRLKLEGLTVDQLEVDMNRDRRAIGTIWSRRNEWRDRIVPKRECPVTLDDIRRVVCCVTKTDKIDFMSHRRSRKASEARHVFIWIARKYTERSFPQIARYVGRKDHTTAMHGYDRINAQWKEFRSVIGVCLCDLGLELPELDEVAA